MKRTNKFLSGIFVLFALLASAMNLISCNSISELEYKLNEGGESYSVVGIVNVKNNNIDIPTTYNNKPVTIIAVGAFANCDNIVSISIPNGIVSIEHYAFYNCNKLSSISIPASVTNIDETAFVNCSGIESISVDNCNEIFSSVNNCLIKDGTIVLGCKNSIIPTDFSVNTIGKYAFCGCDGLTSITIPNGVLLINDFAFERCANLERIEFDGFIFDVSSLAFYCCSGIEEIIVINSATYKSVSNCLIDISLETVVLGCKNSIIPLDGSVTTIGEYAFAFCYIENIVIPDYVTEIGRCAFYCCKSASIMFEGTVAQWQAITKGKDWIANAPATKIICSNGEVGI